MTYFFTGDQHLGHWNISRYCGRPFQAVEEMDETIIANFNSAVSENDITIHLGDFTLISNPITVNDKYVKRLNGNHIFLKGSHDRWLSKTAPTIWDLHIVGSMGDISIVCCHYAMRTWHKSHFNSIQLYGHSHGTLEPIGKQWDVGVDNNNFFPLSLEQIIEIMKNRPDNPNFIPEEKRHKH